MSLGALVHPAAAQVLAEQLQQVVNDDLLWGASDGPVAAVRWQGDQGVHHDASVRRSHGQLGDDLHLDPALGVAVAEASGELDRREEDSVVRGTEDFEGDFDDKLPEGLVFIDAVGLEERITAAKALSGVDQGKLAAPWIPDHVVDLGDVTEKINLERAARFGSLAGLQEVFDLGKDGVVLQLPSGVDQGELLLGRPAVHHCRGEPWDPMLDDEGREAVEQVQGVKRPGPLWTSSISSGRCGKRIAWRNVELVHVGAGKDSQEAIKARLGDRAAMEEHEMGPLRPVVVPPGEVPEERADALECRIAGRTDVEDEGAAALDTGRETTPADHRPEGLAVRELD